MIQGISDDFSRRRSGEENISVRIVCRGNKQSQNFSNLLQQSFISESHKCPWQRFCSMSSSAPDTGWSVATDLGYCQSHGRGGKKKISKTCHFHTLLAKASYTAILEFLSTWMFISLSWKGQSKSYGKAWTQWVGKYSPSLGSGSYYLEQ